MLDFPTWGHTYRKNKTSIEEWPELLLVDCFKGISFFMSKCNCAISYSSETTTWGPTWPKVNSNESIAVLDYSKNAIWKQVFRNNKNYADEWTKIVLIEGSKDISACMIKPHLKIARPSRNCNLWFWNKKVQMKVSMAYHHLIKCDIIETTL